MRHHLKQLFVILGVIFWQCVWAQYHPILDRFSVFEREGKVYLTWTISKGQTCIGTQIFRSTDDYNYQLIHTIGGICGYTDRPQTFEFVDKSPVRNNINHYKLFLDSGMSEPSVNVAVLDIAAARGRVVPNPLISDGKLYFENDNNDNVTITILNATGQLIQSLDTSVNFIDLNKKDYPLSGIYYYTIKQKQIIIASGSFTNI